MRMNELMHSMEKRRHRKVLFSPGNHSMKLSGGIFRLDKIGYYFPQTTMGFSSLKDNNDW